MGKKIELAFLEKTSTLVRNVILIIGAIATAAVFISDRFGSGLTVYVDTLYFSGNNTIIAATETQSDTNTLLTGRLGTITQAIITNKSHLPVSLEIRIPKTGQVGSDRQWPFFTTISASPRCYLKENELKISNGGTVLGNYVGSVEVNKFPPDCTLDVTIASTAFDEISRFMSGKIEVFYDGKKAEIDRAAKIYGVFSKYINLIERVGFLGIIVFVILPILIILFGIVWVMESLPKKQNIL